MVYSSGIEEQDRDVVYRMIAHNTDGANRAVTFAATFSGEDWDGNDPGNWDGDDSDALFQTIVDALSVAGLTFDYAEKVRRVRQVVTPTE